MHILILTLNKKLLNAVAENSKTFLVLNLKFVVAFFLYKKYFLSVVALKGVLKLQMRNKES